MTKKHHSVHYLSSTSCVALSHYFKGGYSYTRLPGSLKNDFTTNAWINHPPINFFMAPQPGFFQPSNPPVKKRPITYTYKEYIPSSYAITKCVWQGANSLTVITSTCAVITLVQSPLNSMMFNYLKFGQLLPPGRIGFKATLYNMYLGSNITGSAARTAYVATAKKNSAPTEPYDARVHFGNNNSDRKTTISSYLAVQMGYVASISCGDVALTQVPDNRAQLIKAQVIDYNFNWKTIDSLKTLSCAGLTSRYIATMIGFSSLCIMEPFYSNKMPFSDLKVNHFLGGAASGITSAVLTSPIALYHNRIILNSAVHDGRLTMPGFFSIMSYSANYIKTQGLSCTLNELTKAMAVQIPLKTVRTGFIFAFMASFGTVCGKEPLASVIKKPDILDRPTLLSQNGLFAQSYLKHFLKKDSSFNLQSSVAIPPQCHK